MIPIIETIKEYLVGLGFEVDKGTYNTAKKSIDALDKGITQFAGDTIKNFAGAAAAVTSFGIAASSAIVGFVNGLANQNIQMEILSRQLWTTQQQAYKFSLTLKAMNTSLQDLYLSPTLMEQYNHLMGVANQMQTPGDFTAEMQQIQGVQLQIKQMRLEAYYSLQWIGYYFIKYMAGPISKVHDVLTSINQVIIKNMPTWTKHVTDVMYAFMQAGVYIVQALEKIWTWLGKLLSYIPGWAKGIAAALALISISNPFMLMVEGISAAILLFDDFMTYIHHGKAEFPGLWRWVMKVADALKKMGADKKAAQALTDAFRFLGDALKNTATFATKLIDTFSKNGTLKNYTGAVVALLKAMGALAGAIGNVITGIGHLFGLFNKSGGQSGMVNFFQLLADVATRALKTVAGILTEIGTIVNVIGDALHGHWGAALGAIKSMWTGQNLVSNGILSQSPYTYVMNHNTASQQKSVNLHAPLINNIYGTSPQATANAIGNGYNRHLHNLRSVIG